MHINDSLNLVFPIRSDEKGVRVYGYHTPISNEVFEANFIILAATKASLTSKGIHYLMDSGPRIAALTLKSEARKDAQERGDMDKDGEPSAASAHALLAELKRLTMIVAPTPNGWDSVPVETAIAQGVIDKDDWAEAEAALTFFTCHYALTKRSERRKVIPATASVLMGSSTSSTLSEFLGSLQTSTQDAPIEEKAGSSVPS